MSEQLLAKIAHEYAERTGAMLRAEITAQSYDTASLDRRVRAKIKAMRRHTYLRVGGLLAACVLLALIAPMMLRHISGTQTPDSHINVPSDSQPTYEIIPLAYSLPDSFTIAAVEQDVEKTVYYLESTEYANVVMTLQTAADTAFFSELTPRVVNGQTVYASEGGGYCLLTFELDDILYILTSATDPAPLYRLCENFL